MGRTLHCVYEAKSEKFFDKYTVIFSDGATYTMSFNADSPQGICQYIGNEQNLTDPDGELVEFLDLPQGVRNKILDLEQNV